MLKIVKKSDYDGLSVRLKLREEEVSILADKVKKLEKENEVLREKEKLICEELNTANDKLKKIVSLKKTKEHLAKKKWLNSEYGEDYEEHGNK